MKGAGVVLAVVTLHASLCVVAAVGDTYGTEVNGITWVYTEFNEWWNFGYVHRVSIGGYTASNKPITAVPTTTSGSIKIPNTLNGNDVVAIKGFAFTGCDLLTCVEIPYNLRGVVGGTFGSCRGLMSINAGTNHPKYKSINGLLLSKEGLTLVAVPGGLTSVSIPDGVTSIGNSAFYDCSGLTIVTIPNSVTSIGDYAFCNCSGLTNVTIPCSTANIGQEAFCNCSNLASITIPDGVTNIGVSAFSHCSRMTSVTIPDSVTSIGSSTFSDCSGLTGAAIPNSVTNIGNLAYYNCSGLVSVTIPDSVTSIGYQAFYNCSGLTSVTIGSGVVDIGDGAFIRCTNLVKVLLPIDFAGSTAVFPSCATVVRYKPAQIVTFNANGGTVTSESKIVHYGSTYGELPLPSRIEGEFQGWRLGDSIVDATSINQELDDHTLVAEWLMNQYWVSFDANGGTGGTYSNKLDYGSAICAPSVSREGYTFAGWAPAVSATVPAEDITYTAQWEINRYMVTFDANGGEGGTGLEYEHGSTVTAPDVSREDYTFLGWFTDPNEGDEVSETVTNGFVVTSANRFYAHWQVNPNVWLYTTSGGNATITGNSTPSGDLSIPSELGGCPVTSIGTSAFSDCGGLTAVTIPDSVTNIGSHAFYNCSRLRIVRVGNGVASMGLDAFYGCSNMRGVYISDVAAWCGISVANAYATPLRYSNYLYLGDNLITELTIPDSVASIGNSAFRNCTRLTSITIPDSVTNIMDSAFLNCSGLTDVTIPDSVVNIGDNAFKYCSGLTNIIFEGDAPTVGLEVFAEVNQECKGVISRSASGWGEQISGNWNGLLITYPWYQVEFDATGGNCEEERRTVGHGLSVGDLPTPVKTGYTFDGWYSGEGSGKSINSNDTVMCDMQLRAYWTPNKYLVTFDANGGVGGTSDNLDYESTIAIPTVTREGYTFKGWTPEVANMVPLEGATYTAQWEINQYTVTFDANGGVGGTSGKQDYGAAIVTPTVTRTGYTFKGWSPSVTATVPANDVTYTAQWEINQYTVTFNANGGTGGKSGKQEYGSAIAAPTVTRTGYTFKGWSPSVVATVPANDVTYVAQWEINQYTVTFNANGGTGGKSGKQEYGSAIAAPTVTRTGYTFRGWSPSVAATVPANDVTYVAQWEINQYTVTFNANGGTGGKSGKQDYGTAIVAPAVTRTGYTFKGWSPSVATTVPANDVTYTAQWEVNQYTVTFNPNGGVGGTSGKWDYGSVIVAPTVTREGYTFAGWSPNVAATVPGDDVTYTAQWTPNKYTVTFAANGGTGGTSGELDYESTLVAPTVTRTGYTFDGWSPNVPATVPLGGGTYTAQWKINQYTVAFNANGGIGGTSGKQDYGTEIVAPTVTREGYTFKGWSPSLAATVPAGNVTYTARWEINKYIVTFDANGGECGTETTAIEHGSAIGTLPVPTREKAAFLGWFTEVDGGVAVDELLTIMEPITLYAHWLTEVASPVITTDGEVVFRMDSCDVSITCATEGASIYYTDDGSTPRINDAYLYNGPITISETATFKAVAVIGDARSDYTTVTITKKLLTLKEALDGGEEVAVATSGTAPWYPILDSNAEVGDATARSCKIGDRTNTWLSVMVEGAGTMSFWCKVSCEHDDDNTFTWDRLMVYTNDVEIVEWRMDGETDWTQRTLSFEGGTNTVKWVYFKDRNVSEGEDCAWVDGLVWTPSGPVDTVVSIGGKEVTVAKTWLEAHENIVRESGGDVAAALQSMAANGRLSNVECYVLGLDPEDATNDFKIVSFPMKADGTPDIDNIVFDPPQAKWNVPATYKVMGAADLGGPWEDVPDGGGRGVTALPLRFFKVIVELP